MEAVFTTHMRHHTKMIVKNMLRSSDSPHIEMHPIKDGNSSIARKSECMQVHEKS